jgi:hypothetical protein
MNTKYTRQQYINKECTHEQYYSQFVDTGILQTVKTLSMKSLVEGKDEHFNNIPLQTWDRMAALVPLHIGKKLRELGDGISLAGAVCILKEAARQLVEKKLAC